tara:strand:+ start:4037 stop:4273 length:237 start_codon:yes stop_codon:yes gene_type:complete
MAEAKHVGDQSYTNAELLAIWEEAWARCGKAGISYTNRSIGVVRAGPDEILRQIKYLKAQISSESGGFVRNKASLKSR